MELGFMDEERNYNLMLNFGIFFVKTPRYNNYTIFSNYYVLARRGKFLVINPYALSDFFSRITTMFRYFEGNKTKCTIWVFSFLTKYSMVARWFAWTTKSYVFAKLSREVSIVGTSGQYLAMGGNISSYVFMNFLGIDVGFVLNSQSSNGRASSLTDRGILTIGFDGYISPVYAYNCPGTRSTRSTLLYSRFFSILVNRILR